MKKVLVLCSSPRALGNTEKCFQNDDMTNLIEKVLSSDVIVFATPVYFYTMSAQMKVFIDRLTPIYEKVRADIYILATAWDSYEENLELTAESIRGLTDMCFEDCLEKGCLLVGGCEHKGDILNKKAELLKAYVMGKNC